MHTTKSDAKEELYKTEELVERKIRSEKRERGPKEEGGYRN